MRRFHFFILLLLIGVTSIWSQTKVPPPGWYEGDALAESSLSGIWWVKVPFRFVDNGTSVEAIKNEVPWSPRYVTFEKDGIIYKSGLGRDEKKTAVGVWLLKDGKLYLTIVGLSLELSYYMVQNDKILVAGISKLGNENIAVAGMLIRLREGQAMDMNEE
jgi:hypothetical protein